VKKGIRHQATGDGQQETARLHDRKTKVKKNGAQSTGRRVRMKKMQSLKCKMQSLKCKMQNAKCKEQNGESDKSCGVKN
jgi:hypothetical protein